MTSPKRSYLITPYNTSTLRRLWNHHMCLSCWLPLVECKFHESREIGFQMFCLISWCRVGPQSSIWACDVIGIREESMMEGRSLCPCALNFWEKIRQRKKVLTNASQYTYRFFFPLKKRRVIFRDVGFIIHYTSMCTLAFSMEIPRACSPSHKFQCHALQLINIYYHHCLLQMLKSIFKTPQET